MSTMAGMLMVNIALAGGLWPFGGTSASDEGTIASLESAPVVLKREPDLPAGGAALARQQYREFLAISADHPELRREALRRLGDLHVEAGEEAQFQTGEPDSADYRTAIALYLELLDGDGPVSGTDRVLYQLARAQESIGDLQASQRTLDRLVAEYPDSIFFDEAQFRRAEYFFTSKRYRDAELACEAILANLTDSIFDEQARYKLGWSLFKQAEYARALVPFVDLIDGLMGDHPQVAVQNLPRPQREMLDDTLRVVSLGMSYLGGAAVIDQLPASSPALSWSHLLYAGLGDLYVSQERFGDAADAFAAYVERYPDSDLAPAMQLRVIDAYSMGRFPERVLEAKARYVGLYGLDRSFWAARSPADFPAVVAVLKESLGDLAAWDHAAAQETGDSQAYGRAAEWYRSYLSYFPDDPGSAQRSFMLAEIRFELGAYDQATQQYVDAAYGYGPHEHAAEAGYASILAAREHESRLAEANRSGWHLYANEIGLRFAEEFPGHPQAPAVRTNVAEEYFAEGQLDAAISVAALVVGMQPPASIELERTAWTVIAHSQFDLARYGEAEQAYVRLKQFPSSDSLGSAEIDRRIAASIYRQGEALQASGDIDAAVEEYLRVAVDAPESEIAPTGLYDAAALLIRTERWPAAIDVLARFRARYPSHALNDDVTRKLAVANRSDARYGPAAAEYERVANQERLDEPTRRDALWLAADLYGQAEQVPDQARVLQAIVTRYPWPVDESIEARQQLADLAEDPADRLRWLETIIEVDAAAGMARTARTTTLAAQAAMELAAQPRDAFNAIGLRTPLKDALRIKKQQMELALAAYGRAAAYGISSITTEATYRIGDIYFRLSTDLMASERPGELTDEELEQYEILLEEQAFPFEEKAIEIFDANAGRAADGIYDRWIIKSYERLAELMPARYAKTERSETLVAELQ